MSASKIYSVKLRKLFSDNGLWIATRDRILAIACIKRDASPYRAKCWRLSLACMCSQSLLKLNGGRYLEGEGNYSEDSEPAARLSPTRLRI